MTFKKYNYKITKFYKQRTIKFGRRSIYDIIKDEELDLRDKIDYIRHHYTYYEGNYNLFHDKRGKGNKYKEKLNNLIKAIILGNKNPSELKKLNKLIMKRHKKLKKQEEQKRKELELKLYEKRKNEMDKFKIDDAIIDDWANKCLSTVDNRWKYCYKHYIRVEKIRKYLHSKDNIYTKNEFLNTSYKTMRKIAENWERECELNKYRESVNISDYNFEEIEKYAEILKEKALQK